MKVKIECEVLEPTRIIYHAFSNYRAYKLVGNFKELEEAKSAVSKEEDLEKEVARQKRLISSNFEDIRRIAANSERKSDEIQKIKDNLCFLDLDYLSATISGDAMRDLMYLVNVIKDAKI